MSSSPSLLRWLPRDESTVRCTSPNSAVTREMGATGVNTISIEIGHTPCIRVIHSVPVSPNDNRDFELPNYRTAQRAPLHPEPSLPCTLHQATLRQATLHPATQQGGHLYGLKVTHLALLTLDSHPYQISSNEFD